MEKELTQIKVGNIVKRILALIMDGCVTIFTFFALAYLVFSPIANKTMDYKSWTDKGAKLQLDSHLYVKINENDDFNYALFDINEQDLEKVCTSLKKENGVLFLKEQLHYYYLNFKSGNVEKGSDFAPDYNVPITSENGVEILPSEYFTENWFLEKFPETMSTEDCLEAMNDAANDFGTYYLPVQKEIMKRELFIIIPSYIISFGIFFFLVPLLYKNGETFGKKTLHLGFVTKDGYSVQKRQIITRQLFIFVLVTISAFGIGIGFTSLATLLFGVAIYIIATACSKSWRSVADLLAYTLLINTRDSVWFESPDEEAKREKDVQDQMNKYSKYEPENKHVIQVGSTIVDEEIKKEFLESQKKNSNNKK